MQHCVTRYAARHGHVQRDVQRYVLRDVLQDVLRDVQRDVQRDVLRGSRETANISADKLAREV